MDKQPRVLLIAESANPSFTSVPLVGWSMAEALLRCTDGHLVTQIRNNDAILSTGLVSKDDFTPIDSEFIARKVYALNSVLRKIGLGWTATTALVSISYYYFEYLAWKQFGQALRDGEYDLVHRITPLSPSIASPYFAKKCAKLGIPFVIGPLNGGVPWPKGYRSVQRREGEWLSYARGLYKLLPGYRATRKHASAIITGSWTTRDQLPNKMQKKCAYIVENAIDPRRFGTPEPRPTTRPLRAAFIGRLVPCKSVDIVLDAAAQLLKDGELIIDIFGTGPETKPLQDQCDRLGISGKVHFHGWINHADLQEQLTHCDMLVFPSIRDFGGGVVLEAMAMGLIPVVIDYAGPGELVTKETGFRVPVGSRESIVENYQRVLTSVVKNMDQLIPMRQAGLELVKEHFTWDAKAQKVLDVYRWVLGETDKNPEFIEGFLSSQRPMPTS